MSNTVSNTVSNTDPDPSAETINAILNRIAREARRTSSFNMAKLSTPLQRRQQWVVDVAGDEVATLKAMADREQAELERRVLAGSDPRRIRVQGSRCADPLCPAPGSLVAHGHLLVEEWE